MIRDKFRSLSPKIFLVTLNIFYKKIFWDFRYKNFFLLFFKHMYYKNVKSN